MAASACHRPPGGHSVLRRFAFLLFLLIIFLYLNAESPRPLGTASPNFQGSRMVGWIRPSFSPIFKFLSWRGAGVERMSGISVGCLEFLLDLELFRVGVAQFIVNIFSPVRKVEKNWCPFTSGIPSRIKPCRILCAILAGGDNFRGVKLFWLFIEHGRERIADRV